jgi:zinc transport system substrate-binding protein
MKRSFTGLTVALIALALNAGCTQKKSYPAAETGNKINITATIFAPYDFAREVAGDRANVTMLLPPGSESHSYEPTPRDLIAIQNSDVFIYVGGESDTWVERILESMDSGMEILALMDTVQPVEEELVEGMEEEEEEEEEAAYDEHVWTSPRNAVQIVTAITELLCERDGENADYYRLRAEAYIAKLEELDGAFRAVVDAGIHKTIVFGDRFPFRYFTDAYGLSYYAAFPGCSTETEPSAATVAFLIDKIKSDRLPVVFHIELSNERMADTIAEATGAKKLLLHASHNISKNDFEAGLSYLDIMKGNVETLRVALESGGDGK